MNNFMFPQISEWDQDLNRKPSDQVLWYSLEIVVFDELVKIDWKHFEGYAEVTTEHEEFSDFYYVFIVVFIMFLHMFKNPNFHNSLLMKSFFIPNNLKCNIFF